VTEPLFPFPPVRANGLMVAGTRPDRVADPKVSGALGEELFRFAAAALPVTSALSVSVLLTALACGEAVPAAVPAGDDEQPASASAAASTKPVTGLFTKCLPLDDRPTLAAPARGAPGTVL
jgi:hypothetical protein